MVIRPLALFAAEYPHASLMRIVLDRLAAIRAIPLPEFLRAHPPIVDCSPTGMAATDLVVTYRLKSLTAPLARLFFSYLWRVCASLSDVIARTLTGSAAIYLLAAFADEHLSALRAFGFLSQHWLVRFFVVVRATAVFAAENPDARAVRIVLNWLAAIRAIP